MKNSITNYENTFYLNGVALSGINSVDGSYSIDYKPINIIGKGYTKQVIASVPQANISIKRYLVNNDPIFDDKIDNFCNFLAIYKKIEEEDLKKTQMLLNSKNKKIGDNKAKILTLYSPQELSLLLQLSQF